MARVMNEETYDELISCLNTFSSNVSMSCSNMQSAAQDCVDNMEGDEAAAKAKAKLDECIKAFNSVCQLSNKLAQALQRELERAQEAQRQMDDMD